MPGNADVHDEVLARAAAGGDRDAFATLFERHLTPVFEAAWLVLHDRAVAAEIARDTFAAAWQHAGAVEPAAFADSLVESADHKATAWLNENPQALATANAPIPDGPPGIGPVLRARIVSALEVHGVPTRLRVEGGPSRERRERVAPRFSGLLAGRARLGILGAAAAVLLVAGIVVISDGAGGSDADDDIETAAGDEDPKAVRDVPWNASSNEDDDDDQDPTPSTASSTTTTGGTSTTEASDTTEEPTSSTSRPRTTTTTARPSNPSPTPTPAPTTPTTAPPPPTTAAPTQPTILEFTARRDGKCQDGREWVVFTWRAVQATWAWIWPSNAPDPWQDLPGLNGSTGRCSWPGERWNLSIRRQSDGKEVWKTITV